MCSVLNVSEPGYYKFLKQQDRPDRHVDLLAQIYECINEDPENANYGYRRIYDYLRINRNRTESLSTIYRVCKANNLLIRRPPSPKGITKADEAAQKAENLIKQDFSASEKNTKWLTDITEIPFKDGKLYLAPVLDCFDGVIVGFEMACHMQADLCVDAFKNACYKTDACGMIIHSDRGSQYTSQAFRECIADYGAIQSMSGTGNCYDNARMESFFATLKKEKLYKIDTRKLTFEELKTIIYRYIQYYNNRRIYSTNGGYPPMVFRAMARGQALAA